jgi:Fur family ferric uptake transcriptional regulator
VSSGSAATRTTRQRTAIESLLASIHDFHSARDLHARLTQQGSHVGLSTVYRTLQAMADAGEIDVLRQENGEALYRRCSPVHHHHLVCRQCGRTIEVEGTVVESWAAAVAREHGFVDPTHDVEVFGTCPDCAA